MPQKRSLSAPTNLSPWLLEQLSGSGGGLVLTSSRFLMYVPSSACPPACFLFLSGSNLRSVPPPVIIVYAQAHVYVLHT